MSQYVLILSNNTFNKEIELPQNARKITIGTSNSADIRLRKDDFFESVNFLLINENGNWQIGCAENLYINDGSVAKLLVKKLQHGSEFEIRYQSSEQLVFRVIFQMNFTRKKQSYNKTVDVGECTRISFGDYENNDFILSSQYTKNTEVVLSPVKEGLKIIQATAPYGVYLNGRRAEEGEIIRNTDFFSISDCFFYYKNKRIWIGDDEDIEVLRLPCAIRSLPENYPKFIRNTRIKTVVNDEKIGILDPPNKPQKPKDNLILRLLPSLGMLLGAGIMMHFGGMMVIFAAISGTMAIVTTVATLIENKKQYKKDVKERISTYNNYIENKRNEITEARKKEREELEEIYIDSGEEIIRFRNFSPNLFDRQQKDEDFLCVRLGEGQVEAKREIDYKKKETLEIDELQNKPGELSEEFKYVDRAPVTCNLKEDGVIGICGPESFKHEFFNKILMDLLARQYHNDVRIAFIAEDEHFDWVHPLRFIPHLMNPVTGRRNIVCDEDSKNQFYEYVYNELTTRESAAKDKEHIFDYNIIMFFIDEFGFKNHPISKFIDKAKDLGVTFIFFEDSLETLPQGCVHIISSNGSSGLLIDTADKNKSIEFKYTSINDKQMAAISRLLAPIYTEELSLEGSLTKSLTLFELMEILSAQDLDLGARWGSSQAHKTMKAPIGVSNKGIVELDLHDTAHGPHGLVAGTTGSGKSELLLTYILSMATLYHPYEVGFVIIDFKGGGMANQLKDLPHLVGTITNIDGKEIDRSLKSIKAELKKRQRLFAEAEVNHIDKYILKYKKGEVSIPLPHLILIVDEFAELKAEQPDFMKELISAARIGRSLGVHLILATQKPSGQVDDQIWSNSRFKLCLKVQGPEDSNEVLKSPLAAEIKEPGRAYLQVGNNEIFELFQSGYSGAPETNIAGGKSFKIHEIQNNGRKNVVYQQKGSSVKSSTTQLEAVVNSISQYTKKKGIKKLPPICLPSLSESILYKESKKSDEIGIIADIGLYDDPDNQAQLPYQVNLTNENMLIVGSSQSGKTNLLQTIIKSVSSKYTSEEVNFYILDFASMFLKSYEKMKHVGGVVTPSDDEKLKNLMKLLLQEMAYRKTKFLDAGVSSYSSYLEAGKKDLAQIVVMIDNITVLREMYFEDNEDELIMLCREGQSLGISVIIANSSTSGLSFKYLANFSCKIALFNNDSNEYSTLFDHCREKIADIKGRSLVEIEKEYYECQTYLAFEGEKEIDKIEEILEFVDQVNFRNKSYAVGIPEIPETVTRNYIRDNYTVEDGKFRVPIGLDYNSVSPVVLNMSRLGTPLVISGKNDMGQMEFITYVISELKDDSELYIVDNMNKELEMFKDESNYSIAYTKALDFVKEMEEKLKERYDILSSGEELDMEEQPLITLILNNRDALEAISEDSKAIKAYKNITSKYKSMNVCVIICNFENANISYSSPEIYKMARDNEHFLIFDDLSSVKFVDIPLMVQREYKKKIIKGDAYYLKEDEIIKTKCVM